MKITISVTSEQAKALDQLQADGKLATLGLHPIGDALSTPKGRWSRRAAFAKAVLSLLAERFGVTTKRVSVASSVLSLLCSLSAFLPVWRFSFLVSGIAFSLAGGILGRKHWYLLGLAGLTLVTSVAGWVALPMLTAKKHERDDESTREHVANLNSKNQDIQEILDIFNDDNYPDLQTALKIMKEQREATKGIWVWRDAADGDKALLDKYGFIPEVPEKWMSIDRQADLDKVAEIAKIGGVPAPLRKPDDINLITRLKYGPGYWTFTPDTHYQYTPGKQHLQIRSGNEIVFEGDVLVPDNTKITTKLSIVMGKKVLIFTPDIRIMKN